MTGVGRVVFVPSGQGPSFQLGPDRFVRKGEPPSGEEGFSVIEYEGAPGVPGPPPHVHRAFEEAWYILEGEVAFESAGRTENARKGAYIFVPRGVPHTFRVLGAQPARWVGIFAPGRYVRLIEELGALLPAHGPPDLEQVRRLFARYETDLVA